MLFKGNGEGGIRTRGTENRTLVFETSSLSHSDTSPTRVFIRGYKGIENQVFFYYNLDYNHIAL